MMDSNYLTAPVLHKAGPCMLMPSRVNLKAAYKSDAEHLITSILFAVIQGWKLVKASANLGLGVSKQPRTSHHCPAATLGASGASASAHA